MLSSIFHTILYKPLYNILALLVGILPGQDLGLAVVVLTIIVRLVLMPLTHKQSVTQRKLKAVEGTLNEIKERYKDNKEEQTKAMLELYKKEGINPFSGFLLLLIQIPILLALFWVFTRGLPFRADMLYSFVHLPTSTSNLFLGLFDLTGRNIILALLVGVSQYFQISLSLPPTPKKKDGEQSFGEEFARSMSTNMRYVMPAFVTVVAMGFPAVVALYWLTSNIFMIGQELFIRRKAKLLVASH